MVRATLLFCFVEMLETLSRTSSTAAIIRYIIITGYIVGINVIYVRFVSSPLTLSKYKLEERRIDNIISKPCLWLCKNYRNFNLLIVSVDLRIKKLLNNLNKRWYAPALVFERP